MRRLVSLVAVSVLACGCGPDSTAQLTTPSISAIVEPTYPNVNPGERPPVRPADALSDAGAKAFAVYFVKTIDWAYASMDTTLLEAASTAECHLCGVLAKIITDRRALGDVYSGSRFTVLDAIVDNGPTDDTRLVNVVFSYTELYIRHPDGSAEFDEGAHDLVQLNVRVRFASDTWATYEAKRVVTE